MKSFNRNNAPWMLILLLLMAAVVACLGDQEDDLAIPALDTSRVDDLGWTDAHHVAHGSPLCISSSTRIMVPSHQRLLFLQDTPDEYLCQRNDFGQTALHLAVRENALDIVELFVDRKLPCLNLGNSDGDTPLHYAAAWGRLEAAQLLIRGGADPTRPNDTGKLPCWDAKQRGYEEIATLLLTGTMDENVRGSRLYRAILKRLGSWMPPGIALLFVISFELGRRQRERKG